MGADRQAWNLGSDAGAPLACGADLRGNICRWCSNASLDGHRRAAIRRRSRRFNRPWHFWRCLARGARGRGALASSRQPDASYPGVRWPCPPALGRWLARQSRVCAFASRTESCRCHIACKYPSVGLGRQFYRRPQPAKRGSGKIELATISNYYVLGDC